MTSECAGLTRANTRFEIGIERITQLRHYAIYSDVLCVVEYFMYYYLIIKSWITGIHFQNWETYNTRKLHYEGPTNNTFTIYYIVGTGYVSHIPLTKWRHRPKPEFFCTLNLTFNLTLTITLTLTLTLTLTNPNVTLTLT